MTGLQRVRSKLGLLARIFLGGVFLAAAGPKLLDPLGFAQSIANYRLLPDVLIGYTALLLPGVELIVGAALVAGVAMNAAVILAESMLLVFLLAMLQGILRGIDVSCGCFGVDAAGATLGWLDLLRDLALMGLGGVAWWGAGDC